MTSLLTTTALLPQLSASSLVRTKGRIRPLNPDDIGQITDLYSRAAGRPVSSSASLMKRLFFELPWHQDSFSSLACEDVSGRLIGCLGVMLRPMVFRGRPIRAAVAHHFIVESSRRGTRAGIELTRRFLGGPQDLSLASSDEAGRRIWTFLEGSVTPLHSFSWTRALRPARYALGILRERGLPASAAVTLHPACRAVDATLNLFAQRSPAQRTSSALSDDLDAVTMLACLSAFTGDRALRPCYDVPSLAWLLDTLDAAHDRGRLHKVAVRTQSGRPLGWYLYHIKTSGTAEVLQVGGKDDAVGEVLNHLFDHARQRGALAVTGPMDARLVAVLSDNQCVFQRPGNSWTLIHSRDPLIADAIHSGDAFLSRLEGASWAEPETRSRR